MLILFAFNFGTRNELEGFGYAVIIGVFVGTYSSMFVASPALLWPESRRQARSPEGGDDAGVVTPRRGRGLTRASGYHGHGRAPPSGPVGGTPPAPIHVPTSSAGRGPRDERWRISGRLGPLSHNRVDPFPMRALIGLVVLGTLFIMAASWQSG